MSTNNPTPVKPMQPFLKDVVEDARPDGYWLEAFPFKVGGDDAPMLVGYGLGTSAQNSTINMFINPYDGHGSGGDVSAWQKTEIATLAFPVACTYADISGNGFNDIILSDNYGPGMTDLWGPDKNGGRVQWYENTGDIHKPKWTARYIGKRTGMHRLKTGHFTTHDKIQIWAAPVINDSSDYTTPAPMIVFTQPDDVSETKGWPSHIAGYARLVHDVVVVPGRDGGLDRILLSMREGVELLWYDLETKEWQSHNVGSGLPQTDLQNPYWGSGSVDLAKFHDDTSGYFGCCEAFHGNIVSVYVKESGAPKHDIAGVKWTRHVLDDFGPLSDEHTGSIHQVVCADIDGDGVEELLVAFMGSKPTSWMKEGVWCYKPVDLANGQFVKSKLSNVSAGRIALGDYMSRKALDFATISYSVPGYFESPNPSINVFLSTFITAEKLGEEVLFRVPRPASAWFVDSAEFLDVAGRKLTLVVVPPNTTYQVAGGDGLKVIAGQVSWKDDAGHQERTLATMPFSQVSIEVNAKDGLVRTQAEGAIFLLMKNSGSAGSPSYSDMKQLKATNLFSSRFSDDIRNLDFPWVKVEDRPWANGGFKDLEFYNLVGFHVRYADDSDDSLCHIQLWTAGVGVSAGFHNHAGKSFCEIHACIVNGTGAGGMYWAKQGVKDEDFDAANPDRKQYEGLTVPTMSEHGPLWRTGKDGLPMLRANDTVDYPWHAWIAGGSEGESQSFDVWLAFEFPPFLAGVEQSSTSATPVTGTYRIVNVAADVALGVKNGDATDGTPLVTKSDDGEEYLVWSVTKYTGTGLHVFTNAASGSMATSVYPPTEGQQIVGSRSPANLYTTSAWSLETVGEGDDLFKVRLIGTDLVLTTSGDDKVVVKGWTGDDSQKWAFRAS